MNKTNYLLMTDNESSNYRKYPLIKKSNRRFISAFFFDHDKNNIVCTNGKSLLRVSANLEEKLAYKNNKFIMLSKEEPESTGNFPPYERIMIENNESTAWFISDLKTIIKQLKELKKQAKQLIFNDELYVYYNSDINEFLMHNDKFNPDSTTKRFNLNLLLNTFITLYNLRGNIEHISYTNLINKDSVPCKINSNKFDIIIMPCTY